MFLAKCGSGSFLYQVSPNETFSPGIYLLQINIRNTRSIFYILLVYYLKKLCLDGGVRFRSPVVYIQKCLTCDVVGKAGKNSLNVYCQFIHDKVQLALLSLRPTKVKSLSFQNDSNNQWKLNNLRPRVNHDTQAWQQTL